MDGWIAIEKSTETSHRFVTQCSLHFVIIPSEPRAGIQREQRRELLAVQYFDCLIKIIVRALIQRLHLDLAPIKQFLFAIILIYRITILSRVNRLFESRLIFHGDFSRQVYTRVVHSRGTLSLNWIQCICKGCSRAVERHTRVCNLSNTSVIKHPISGHEPLTPCVVVLPGPTRHLTSPLSLSYVCVCMCTHV